MTIGGIEARHAAVFVVLAKSRLEVFPDQRGFFPGTNPLPEAAVLSASRHRIRPPRRAGRVPSPT